MDSLFKNKDNYALIKHPLYRVLIDEINFTQNILWMEAYKKENLDNNIEPILFNIYLKKVKPWEIELENAKIPYLRMRRKIDLVQAYTNRGERVNLHEIEQQLDMEFYKYMEIINNPRSASSSVSSSNEGMSLNIDLTGPRPSKPSEYRKLYIEIIKRLHPDLNSILSSVEKDLLNKAIIAYKLKDEGKIERIYELVICLTTDFEYDPNSLYSEKTLKELQYHKNRISSQILAIRRHIEFEKNRHPYNLLEILIDDEKLDEYINCFKEKIIVYNEEREQYRKILKKTLRENFYATR